MRLPAIAGVVGGSMLTEKLNLYGTPVSRVRSTSFSQAEVRIVRPRSCRQRMRELRTSA